MWRRLVLVNLALCLVSFSVVEGFKSTCKPLSQGKCAVCTNCKYCILCSQNSGVCSVCAVPKRR